MIKETFLARNIKLILVERVFNTLQTKLFLSDSDGNSSQFCSAADYFNAWVKDNPTVEIKDVKFQHAMTTDKYNDDSVMQASSIFVLFKLPLGSEPFTRFKWNSIWNRASLFFI